MPKPYDVITRTILERYPRDWLALIDLDPAWPVRVVDSDLSTVVAEADKVLRVEGEAPGLVHFEVQKGYDASLPARLLRYNALLTVRHGLPVLSVVVLLVPDADGPAVSGRYLREWPDARSRIDWTFPVVRVWEHSAAELAATLGTLPLSALAASDGEDAVRVLTPALAAFGDPPTPAEREIATACYLLAGLRFDRETVLRIFRGTQSMRESVTYQAILEEGEAIGLQKGFEKGEQAGEARGRIVAERDILLRLAERRFGQADAAARARIEAVADAATLESLIDRVLDAKGWDDLLAGLS